MSAKVLPKEDMLRQVFPPCIFEEGEDNRRVALALTQMGEGMFINMTARGYAVVPLGSARLFNTTSLVDVDGHSFMIAPALLDPIAVMTGKLPVPRRPLSMLRQLHREGFEFQAIYVVHEIAGEMARQIRGGSVPLKAVMPAQPPEAVALATSLGAMAQRLVKWTTGTLAAGASLLGQAAVATAAVAMDPAVIGAVTLSGQAADGEPACFFELTHWDWPVPLAANVSDS